MTIIRGVSPEHIDMLVGATATGAVEPGARSMGECTDSAEF